MTCFIVLVLLFERSNLLDSQCGVGAFAAPFLLPYVSFHSAFKRSLPFIAMRRSPSFSFYGAPDKAFPRLLLRKPITKKIEGRRGQIVDSGNGE